MRAVVPNYHVKSSLTPNDPYFPYQWNLTHAQVDQLWDSPGADGQGAVVAVLDTGLAYTMIGNDPPAPDIAPGRVQPGHDFVNGDPIAEDDNGHGTHMAAIILQTVDNNLGVAGMAPGVTVMPIKVLDDHGVGTLAWLVEGIDLAVQRQADVINMSLTLPAGTPANAVLEDALRQAYESGVVLVGAAGNQALPNVSFPAASNYVIAVGASNYDDERATYSNFGAALDILAPGGDFEDRDSDGKPEAILQVAFAPGARGAYHHYFGAGTSQAAAHVSGLSAVLVGRVAAQDRPLHVRNLIQGLASSGTWGPEAGYGIIKALDSWNGQEPGMELEDWGGHVPAPETTYPDGSFAILHDSLVDGLLLLLFTPEDGAVGLVDQGVDVVLAFDLPSTVPLDLFTNGVGTFLAQRGGVSGLISGSSTSQSVSAAGGLMILVDPSGGLGDLVSNNRASGSTTTVLFSADSETILQQIEGSGGLVGLLNGSGGLVGLLNGSGGLVGLLNGSGGLMGLLNGSGGLVGLLDASGMPLGLWEGMDVPSGTTMSNGLLSEPID